MIYTIFLAGTTMATFAASGIFFLKLWKASRDRFFAYFGSACLLLAVERVAALFAQGALSPADSHVTESSAWIYVIRLFAFAMILIAIVGKNRSRKRDIK